MAFRRRRSFKRRSFGRRRGRASMSRPLRIGFRM